jgi:hypothetical protein
MMGRAFCLAALLLAGAQAFAPPPQGPTRACVHAVTFARAVPLAPVGAALRMGNNAPTGPFTPLVLFGKQLLGDKTFNKIRGKLISYHSQIIGYFCSYTGAPRRMNQLLIKKAKINGGRLGFLN